MPRRALSKRRCKQCPQGATTMTDHSNDDVEKASNSGKGRVMIAARSDKHQARPPIEHFKRLLKEAFPNHTCPVGYKLKDCGMMKSFMILRSLTRGTKLDEDPGGSDTMPFPREDVVMTVYGGRSPPRRCHVSTMSPGDLTHCGWGHGDTGV
jgi:hypothetical protein